MVYDFNGSAIDYYKDCHIAICMGLTTLKVLISDSKAFEAL